LCVAVIYEYVSVALLGLVITI